MRPPTVAVIDIGSNSIKSLVARRASGGALEVVLSRSLDARISAGISGATPTLAETGMVRGLGAIRELLSDIRPFAPVRTELVATSAVRDAANGAQFAERVRRETGHAIRILTGDEEATAIGRGLLADPALASLQDYHVFDLGGGSLECLSFQGRTLRQALSLQLGCVRLTEKFVTDHEAPFSADSRAAIEAHVRAEFAASGYRFDLPGATAVGTGGTVATVRSILGARRGRRIEDTAPVVAVAELEQLLADLGALPLPGRKRIAGLPPARADIFPTALAVILSVAALGGFTEFRHSFNNLRWGLAADLLARL